jgi:hypothetical protein
MPLSHTRSAIVILPKYAESLLPANDSGTEKIWRIQKMPELFSGRRSSVESIESGTGCQDPSSCGVRVHSHPVFSEMRAALPPDAEFPPEAEKRHPGTAPIRTAASTAAAAVRNPG